MTVARSRPDALSASSSVSVTSSAFIVVQSFHAIMVREKVVEHGGEVEPAPNQ